MIRLTLLVIFIMTIPFAYGQNTNNNDYLNRVIKLKLGGALEPKFAYIDTKGDTIIGFGKYKICYTDTFRYIAFVYTSDNGLFAIDRKEKRLFEVLMVGAKPDSVSDGLFRIVKNGKIGFANLKGEVIIEPRYSCANQFNNGITQVSDDCNSAKQTDATKWKGKNWYNIDKSGNRIK